MESWFFLAVILGAVEGLTEFLPVSSTGHLILVGELLGFHGIKAQTFEVVIQLGAIFAVVCLYWERFWGLLFPKGQSFQTSNGLSGLHGFMLLFLTTLPPAIFGFLLHNTITALFTPLGVGAALVVGALCMFWIENHTEKQTPTVNKLDDITPILAVKIGFCQCLALWPGFSRSASTIMGGMFCGLRRDLAAEYSFIAAVPLMVAATGYALLKSWTMLSLDDVSFFLAGMFFSFIFAWLAVKTFIALLARLTLRPFAVYRLILAALVFSFWT